MMHIKKKYPMLSGWLITLFIMMILFTLAACLPPRGVNVETVTMHGDNRLTAEYKDEIVYYNNGGFYITGPGSKKGILLFKSDPPAGVAAAGGYLFTVYETKDEGLYFEKRLIRHPEQTESFTVNNCVFGSWLYGGDIYKAYLPPMSLIFTEETASLPLKDVINHALIVTADWEEKTKEKGTYDYKYEVYRLVENGYYCAVGYTDNTKKVNYFVLYDIVNQKKIITWQYEKLGDPCGFYDNMMIFQNEYGFTRLQVNPAYQNRKEDIPYPVQPTNKSDSFEILYSETEGSIYRGWATQIGEVDPRTTYHADDLYNMGVFTYNLKTNKYLHKRNLENGLWVLDIDDEAFYYLKGKMICRAEWNGRTTVISDEIAYTMPYDDNTAILTVETCQDKLFVYQHIEAGGRRISNRWVDVHEQYYLLNIVNKNDMKYTVGL